MTISCWHNHVSLGFCCFIGLIHPAACTRVRVHASDFWQGCTLRLCSAPAPPKTPLRAWRRSRALDLLRARVDLSKERLWILMKSGCILLSTTCLLWYIHVFTSTFMNGCRCIHVSNDEGGAVIMMCSSKWCDLGLHLRAGGNRLRCAARGPVSANNKEFDWTDEEADDFVSRLCQTTRRQQPSCWRCREWQRCVYPQGLSVQVTVCCQSNVFAHTDDGAANQKKKQMMVPPFLSVAVNHL